MHANGIKNAIGKIMGDSKLMKLLLGRTFSLYILPLRPYICMIVVYNRPLEGDWVGRIPETQAIEPPRWQKKLQRRTQSSRRFTLLVEVAGMKEKKKGKRRESEKGIQKAALEGSILLPRPFSAVCRSQLTCFLALPLSFSQALIAVEFTRGYVYMHDKQLDSICIMLRL